MRDTTVARNYAEALFALAEQHDAHDAFAESVAVLNDVFQADPRVRQFLELPKIDAQAKKQALRHALQGKVPDLFLTFLLVVVDKRRQRLIEEIGEEYAALLDEKFGRLHVQVTLAHEPDAATQERIAVELTRILGRRAIPHVRVDPNIIGGIIVRYGDHVLDGSVRRRLNTLRTRLLDVALPQMA